jgi:hypothetical protein
MFWDNGYNLKKDFLEELGRRLSKGGGNPLCVEEIEFLLKSEPPPKSELDYFKQAFILSIRSGDLLNNYRILNGETSLENIILNSRGKDQFIHLLKGSLFCVDINYRDDYGHSFMTKWLQDLTFEETKFIYDNGYDFNRKIVFDKFYRDEEYHIFDWLFKNYQINEERKVDIIKKVTFLLSNGVSLDDKYYKDFFHNTGASDSKDVIDIYLSMVPYLDNKVDFCMFIKDHLDLSPKQEQKILSYLL